MKIKQLENSARTLILIGIFYCNSASSAQVKTIVAWGSNSDGETNVPSGLSDVVQVDAGFSYSVALKSNGTVVVWGTPTFSWAGTNYPISPAPPTATNVISISAGEYHCLALRNDGTVIGWGYNVQGQATPPPLTNVVAIAAGGLHSLALKADGRVVGWGNNAQGQSTPPNTLSNVVAIAAGENHSLAVKQDGTVVAWGWDYYGQCDVPSGLHGVKSVAADNYQSLALKNDGTIVQWGYDEGPSFNIPPPTNFSAAAVSQDALYSLALMSNATVAVWGNKFSPAVTGIPFGLTNVVGIAAGYDHALAIYLRNIPPTLEFVQSGRNLNLSWPISESGFFLESTTNFSTATIWSPVSIAPVTNGSWNTVTVPISAQQEFFRLESP